MGLIFRRRLWLFSAANLEDLRQYFQDFPWSDLCYHGWDNTECAELIRELILSHVKASTPLSFSHFNANNSRFNQDCSTAVHNKEEAYSRNGRFQTIESCPLHILGRNHAKSIFRLAKSSFIRVMFNVLFQFFLLPLILAPSQMLL